ncbi:hypothetical protein MMC25_006684 [Agyrium rufum]|nr:hypothetical protein [Agyrium rufum]
MDAAAKGATALTAKDYSGAISHYTTALSQNPQAVDYYIKRSTAYTRIQPPQYNEALSDAETALALARKRQKRELIGQAQLRRAISLFSLERYGDAKVCFEWVKKILPKETQLGIWEKKVEAKQSILEDENDERGKVAIEEFPVVDLEGLGARAQRDVAKTQPSGPDTNKDTETKSIAEKQPKEPPKESGVTTVPSKIRHDWYQNADFVFVTLLAKGVPKEKVSVELREHAISISFPLVTGTDYSFDLDPLFAPIDTDSSSYSILPSKVEFKLKKVTIGQKWSTLESMTSGSIDDRPKTASTSTDAASKSAVFSTSSNPSLNSTPSYPTSSKSGPKNWDKVAADLTRKPKPSQSTNSNHDSARTEPKISDGTDSSFTTDSNNETAKGQTQEDQAECIDEDEDEDGGDPVNGFFRKLFKNADPDTKRAMMKSYQESNGTALSTNWSDVGSKKVEVTPPDGMISKKWGE